MKKYLWIIPTCILAILAILFLPIPGNAYDDGGSREFTALTYKIVVWNRITTDTQHKATRIYWGADRNKSLDELWETEVQTIERTFLAQIIEVEEGDTVIVRPVKGEPEEQRAKYIRVTLNGHNEIIAKTGDYLQVTYRGQIMESYPAQINMTHYDFATDLRAISYTDQWINKDTAKKQTSPFVTDMVISYIYKDCFMAYSVIPLPYAIKINGSLSEEWCVGDKVAVVQDNIWYDDETHRYEADLVSISVSDFQPQEGACYKPVIYLYPQEITPVSANLPLNGLLTCTYPNYQNGWRVTAQPDGTLTDNSGVTYNYLYWEGTVNTQWDLSEGFCIAGCDTAAFLEDALNQLGLNRKEANEFIVYWLPLMQNNPYNIISFQSDAYTDAAPLEITPSPDTMIRVFMTWQAADEYTQIPPQVLTAPERKGFTVIEWGGTEIK